MAILTTKTELAVGPEPDVDEMHIVDSSDTTDDPTGTSKRINIGNLFTGIPKQVLTAGVPSYPGLIIIPGQTSSDRNVAQTGDIFIGATTAIFSGDFIIAVANQNSPSLEAHFDLKYRTP